MLLYVWLINSTPLVLVHYTLLIFFRHQHVSLLVILVLYILLVLYMSIIFMYAAIHYIHRCPRTLGIEAHQPENPLENVDIFWADLAIPLSLVAVTTTSVHHAYLMTFQWRSSHSWA